MRVVESEKASQGMTFGSAPLMFPGAKELERET